MVNFIAGTILILVSLVGLIFGCRVWNLHDDSWHKSELLKLLVGALLYDYNWDNINYKRVINICI